MSIRIKYPRTFHLPQSPGATSDDKVCHDLSRLLGQKCVITEKMDGENCTMYNDGVHSRSVDSGYHPSRTWVTKLQAEHGSSIPDNMRVCGENVFAKHSIMYHDLESYFLAFSVWEHATCLSWDKTVDWLDLLNFKTVPVLFVGILTEHIINETIKSINPTTTEGFVIRLFDQFTSDEFNRCVVKWVRPNHVSTEGHWMFSQIVQNGLRS